MKKDFFMGCFLFPFAAAAALGPIYHAGWIDLDKNGEKDVYEDPARPIEERVADLLARMTLDEKIGQLEQAFRGEKPEKEFGERLRRGEISSFLYAGDSVETPVVRNRLQRIAVEQSRLGIPVILGHDSIHGFKTIFPIPLAEACAWDPDLFERTETVSAYETSAAGIDWAFAPMVDLARDPRWGRIAEGYGEDPWLGALYAAACVRGFQGTNAAAPDRVVACLKHYVGYGAAEGGRDYNTTEISDYTLRNFYLPQYKAGIDAGAWTIMSAFNCLSGFPASANHHTLTEILRNDWKFRGFVVSDWTSIEELIPHGVAAEGADAARLALMAGVDMEMVSTNYNTLKEQVNHGKVPLAAVDEAVRRVLTVKFASGLFDHPYVDEGRCKTAFLRPEAVALAREAAAKSCVLLKNEHGTLPLSRQAKKIALIGPLSDNADELLGCWSSRGNASNVVSLAAGLRAKLPSGTRLTVVPGCGLTETANIRMRLDGSLIIEQDTANRTSAAEFSAAVAAAKAADVVILALGEPRGWSGENASRLDLSLPGRQMELFEAVVATGKPVIAVLFNGRPLALPRIQEKAVAILEAWHPGVQGGNGVADVLFGDVDPTGRLTTTFPRSVGQVPLYYNHFNTGRPELGKYIDGPSNPLYPFGFGLAYTTFEFGKAELSATTMKADGALTVGVRIKNTGSRAGTEVAQLYLRDVAASAGPRPVRELKGFQKVWLKPGDSREVSFTISERELGYYDSEGHWLVEPGRFQLWIAKDSASGKPVDFELVLGK